jgi:glyceraldehyde-3-phosphate dehydrogenase/erythrose-4-phosphate dehydrogenase
VSTRRPSACCPAQLKRETSAAEVNSLLKVTWHMQLVGAACFLPGARVSHTRHHAARLTTTPTHTLPYPPRPQAASETYLAGILGFETRPLVSTDYVNDTRSGIVDAACTQVIHKTMVKLYVW